MANPFAQAFKELYASSAPVVRPVARVASYTYKRRGALIDENQRTIARNIARNTSYAAGKAGALTKALARPPIR